MKKAIFAASLLALSCSAAMAADVGVSVTVGQPGFYGRLDVGDFGPPPVIYQQPVIVQRPVRYVPVQPIYLRVPPGHARHWSRHCRAYRACGQPVLFVQDGWYVNDYAPRYRERHYGPGPRYDGRGPGREPHGRGPGREHDGGHGNGHGYGHDNGHDNGHGNGHGNEHGPGRH